MLVKEKIAEAAKYNYTDISLNKVQMGDFELLMNNSLKPVDTFMNKKNVENVLKMKQLTNGEYFPTPIILPINKNQLGLIEKQKTTKIALRDPEGTLLGLLTPNEVFSINELKTPIKTSLPNASHVISGKLEFVERPPHYDYVDKRYNSDEMKRLNRNGKIVAVNTSNVLFNQQVKQIKDLEKEGFKVNFNVNVAPIDNPHFLMTSLKNSFEDPFINVSNSPYTSYSTKDVLIQSIISKNNGANHIIVPQSYDSLAFNEIKNKVGITPIVSELPQRYENIHIGTLLDDIRKGKIENKFFSNEIMSSLEEVYPPKHKQGLCLFFTGLSGSGKSVVSNAVIEQLKTMTTKPIYLLDGDIVRKNLSSELGFSKAHRNLNILRIGFVASLLVRAGAIVVCAPIAPYAKIRENVREMVQKYGNYVEVHNATPIEVCEKRDRKGLYKKARAGIIKNFTGIDDPYEAPVNPEIRLDTSGLTINESASVVTNYLKQKGIIN